MTLVQVIQLSLDVGTEPLGQRIDIALRRFRPLLPPRILPRCARVAHENMLVRHAEASNKAVHEVDVQLRAQATRKPGVTRPMASAYPKAADPRMPP